MSDAPPTILDAETELQPEAIERTLRGLWQDMVEQNTDVTQVRMLNLLAYLPGNPSQEVRQAINAIAVQHPGRAITLAPDDQPPRVETTIACRAGGEKLRACGEQIVLRGSVDGKPVYSLAISLLLGGLPVTVWWQGAVDFGDDIFRQLATAADHVVLDSRTWPDPAANIRSLAEMLAAETPHAWFSDLRWVALTSWRRIMAQAFNVQSARRALPDIGEMTIEYGQGDDTVIDAVLLAAWWMSRTGRVFARLERNATEIVIRARSAPGSQRPPLRIALRSAAVEQRIRRVELSSTGERYGHVLLETLADGRAVRSTVAIDDHPVIEQVTPLGNNSLTALLDLELATVTPDATYEDALHIASDILRAL